MKTLLIYSGKGGVGKSTISFNLAYLLKEKGFKVGLFDADFNTPSIHKLVQGLPLQKRPLIDNFSITPAIYDSILVQSTGFINNNLGVIWNEDYIKGAFYQLLGNKFKDVDYLVIDLPPGISAVHSNICELFPDSVVFFVISPSELSTEDTTKAYNFLKKLNIRILGTIINMSYFICEHCKDKNILHNNKGLNYTNIPFIKDSNLIVDLPYSSSLSYANEMGLPLIKIITNDILIEKLNIVVDNIIKNGK